MILVAGLTPAWQQIVVLDRLQTGEVNRAREVQWCASGKVLNVGLALHELGARLHTLSMIGNGPAGETMRREFGHQRVPIEWVSVSATQRTCTTLLDQDAQQTTEIVENSASVTVSELREFEAAFARQTQAAECEWVVLTGSLPQGTRREFFATLLENCRSKVILDVRGPELLACLLHRPFAVKPNREELAQTVGRPLLCEADVWQAMTDLHQRGARWVIVTDGSKEVLVSNDTSEASRWRFAPPPVAVVNPIGCGDCFTAGLVFSLQRGDEMLDAIRFGIAAAAFNATQLLPARLKRHEVTSLVGQVLTESTA